MTENSENLIFELLFHHEDNLQTTITYILENDDNLKMQIIKRKSNTELDILHVGCYINIWRLYFKLLGKELRNKYSEKQTYLRWKKTTPKIFKVCDWNEDKLITGKKQANHSNKTLSLCDFIKITM